jgi:hypothetical protein
MTFLKLTFFVFVFQPIQSMTVTRSSGDLKNGFDFSFADFAKHPLGSGKNYFNLIFV